MTAPDPAVPARLDHRFHRLFAAGVISNLGDGVFLVALPLVAADLTRDPRQVAGVALALGLPWLLFALVAGALVDRWDRRLIMVTADGARAALVAALALTIAADAHSMPMLYVVAFLLGTAETMFDNAAQTILPSLVDDPDLLPRANGRLFAAETVSNQFVGPPLGGILVAASVTLPFWVDAATFGVAALLVASIPGRFRSAQSGRTARPSLRSEIAVGVRWLWGHTLLRTLALLLGLMNMAFMASWSIMVLFAQDRLGLDEVGFGVLLTSLAFGSVGGGLVASRIAERLGTARLLLMCATGIGATQLVVAPMSNPWVVGVLLAGNGFFSIVWNVVTVSLRQRIIPDELLGRVNSVYRFLGWGAIPIGALVGGLLADAFGLRAPFYVGGAAVVAAVLAASPVITGRRVRDAEPVPVGAVGE